MKRCGTIIVLALAFLVPGAAVVEAALARQVMGTIAEVHPDRILVKTTEGATLAIGIGADVLYLTKQGDATAPASASALTPGLRVVVDVAGRRLARNSASAAGE